MPRRPAAIASSVFVGSSPPRLRGPRQCFAALSTAASARTSSAVSVRAKRFCRTHSLTKRSPRLASDSMLLRSAASSSMHTPSRETCVAVRKLRPGCARASARRACARQHPHPSALLSRAASVRTSRAAHAKLPRRHLRENVHAHALTTQVGHLLAQAGQAKTEHARITMQTSGREPSTILGDALLPAIS